MCCVVGARLVTDDALRVELRGGHARCFSGTRELRLRPAAAELSEMLKGFSRQSTIDQRIAVRPKTSAARELALRAIVAPLFDRGVKQPQVERLRGTEALLELLRWPRTVGWLDAEHARRDFTTLASVAETVPVYRARLPSGPPFRPDRASSILSQVTP